MRPTGGRMLHIPMHKIGQNQHEKGGWAYSTSWAYNTYSTVILYVRASSWHSLLCRSLSRELAAANDDGFVLHHVCCGLIWLIDVFIAPMVQELYALLCDARNGHFLLISDLPNIQSRFNAWNCRMHKVDFEFIIKLALLGERFWKIVYNYRRWVGFIAMYYPFSCHVI